MPSIINASSTGSGGLVQTADASGVLQLQSNGTTAVTVTGANTGFGTASPTSVIQATASSAQIITMERSGVRTWAHNIYGDGHYSLVDVTGSAERFQINSSGNVALSGASQDATGIGITFPAAQSASTNPNCLDDYEEGTFTPTITSQFGTVTTYSSAGTYTKIGRVVTCQININLTTVGSASGFLNFSGLPFTTSGVRRPNVSVAREDASTGVYYGVYVDSSTTGGSISTLTFGGISWTNGFVYVALITYPASS